MKNSARTRRESVEIDRRMFSLAWGGSVLKMLFRIATAGIENGQSKIVFAVGRDCLLIEIARRWGRLFQSCLILVLFINWLNRCCAPDCDRFFILWLNR